MKIYNLSSTINFTGTKINAIIYNDLHGSTKHLDEFEDIQDGFYKQNDGEINLTLSGGDVFLDKSSNNDTVAQRLCKKLMHLCLEITILRGEGGT